MSDEPPLAAIRALVFQDSFTAANVAIVGSRGAELAFRKFFERDAQPERYVQSLKAYTMSSMDKLPRTRYSASG